MATYHASAGEVVDLKTWADDLDVEASKVIKKTKGIELARLVIGAGVNMHHDDYCSVEGPAVFHCIEGEVLLKTPGSEIPIKQGQLVYLEGGTDHSLSGVKKSVVLLTIVLPKA